LTFRGEDLFRTYIGGVSSVFVILTVFAFFVFRFNIMIHKEGTIINKNSFIIKLSKEPEFNPWKLGFDVAFGIGMPLDPSIGYYTVQHVNWHYSNQTDETGARIRN
jgi:hypothetical protein